MVENTARNIDALRMGDHLCTVYDTPEEHLALLSHFMKGGLANGEYCIHVIDDCSFDHLFKALREVGVDPESEMRMHALQLVTKWQYRQTRNVQVPVMVETVGRFMREAAAAGFQTVRLSVDMTWTLDPEVDWGQLRTWEEHLDGLLSEIPAMALCMYNRRLLPPEAVTHGIETHPTLWHNGVASRNPKYAVRGSAAGESA